MRSLGFKLLIWVVLLGAGVSAGMNVFSSDYEVFDGRSYNGLYYPRIDIIEWGQPSHMEFQVYWKGHPVDMSFQLVEEKGRKVMLVNYFIKERGERLCRRVLAPGHFGEKFFVYRDTSDKDMDNTIVSVTPLPPKVGQVQVDVPKYASCEMADPSRSPAGSGPAYPNGYEDQKRTKPDKGAFKKPGAKVPFDDL